MAIDGDGDFGLVDWHEGLVRVDWGGLGHVEWRGDCDGLVSVDWGRGHDSLLDVDWPSVDWVSVSVRGGVSVLSVVVLVVSAVAVVGLQVAGVAVAVSAVFAVGSVGLVGLVIVVSGILERKGMCVVLVRWVDFLLFEYILL